MVRKLVAVSLVLALVAGCGGSDDDPVSPQPDQSVPEDPTADGESESSDGPELLCTNPGPTTIEPGESVQGNNEGWTNCYTLETTGGTLTFELTGLSDNLSLRVGYDDIETLQYLIGEVWDSTNDGNVDEQVVIEAAEPGIYFIAVGPGAFQNSSDYTLTVTEG